ncbi:hypothetical protein [Bradyrhizobium sp. 160]|uniref:hypothetical protein n=1 Tax=Bradyrhizobium sp. 160 TaxID=2782634 RepID=UPI001FF734E9|nr:hypothetical protein [Bradyrhizobium sp. 160]
MEDSNFAMDLLAGSHSVRARWPRPAGPILQLAHKDGQRDAGVDRYRQFLVIQQVRQTIHPLPALPDNDSELSKVSPNGASCHGALADQQACCTMKHQEALVLGALDWNEPHIGPTDRLADHGRVSGVILGPSSEVGFNMGRRINLTSCPNCRISRAKW